MVNKPLFFFMFPLVTWGLCHRSLPSTSRGEHSNRTPVALTAPPRTGPRLHPPASQLSSHSHSMLPVLADRSQTREVGHEGTEVSREQIFQARGCVPRLVSVNGPSSSNWRTVCVFVLWVMNPSEDPSLGPMAW